MKVSIIIPLFNSSVFIQETVESVLNQTYSDIELLLVDDYSTDNTLEVASKFARYDKRVKLLRNAYAKGISSAANTGLYAASGEFIANLDHDDIAHTTRIETQVQYMLKNPSVGVCGTWMQEFEYGEKRWEFPVADNDIKALMILHSPIANPTAMIRRRLMFSNNIFYEPKYDFSHDYRLWTRLLSITTFANIPEVLVNYRIHKTNASRVFEKQQVATWEMALSPLLQNLGLLPETGIFELLQLMRYPDFETVYQHRKNEFQRIIDQILSANHAVKLFPVEALTMLFNRKIGL